MANFLSGTPGRVEQSYLLNPAQQGLQNQSIQQAMSLLGNINNPTGMAAPNIGDIKNQARQQFQSQTIPTIAERFAGRGRSSAFENALGRAGSSLEGNLAGLQYQHDIGQQQFGLQQRGQQQQLLSSLLGLGMQPSFENRYINEQPGLGQGIASGFGATAPYFLQSLFGGGQSQQQMGQQQGGSSLPGWLAALGTAGSALTPYALPAAGIAGLLYYLMNSGGSENAGY